MSNLFSYAEDELKRAGLLDSNDEMNELMSKNILEIIKIFSSQGHSGFSASYAISLLEKLMQFQPLTPLNGNDDEWNDMSEYGCDPGDFMFQNKRCSHVFKHKDGAYDIDGKIFRDSTGLCYTDSESRVYITFPYTPIREYIDVP